SSVPPDDPAARSTIVAWLHHYRHQLALFALQLWSERRVDVAPLLGWLTSLEDEKAEERRIFVAAAIAEGVYGEEAAIRRVVSELADTTAAAGGPQLIAALGGLAAHDRVLQVLAAIAHDPARGHSAIAGARVLLDLGRKSEAADCLLSVGLEAQSTDVMRS